MSLKENELKRKKRKKKTCHLVCVVLGVEFIAQLMSSHVAAVAQQLDSTCRAAPRIYCSEFSPIVSDSEPVFFLYFCSSCQHNCLNSLWHEVPKRSTQNLLQASIVQLLQMHPARRPFEFSELNRPWGQLSIVTWRISSRWKQPSAGGILVRCGGGSFSIKTWQPNRCPAHSCARNSPF